MKHNSKGKIYLDTKPIFYDGIELIDEHWTKCYPYAEEYIDTERTLDPKVKSLLVKEFQEARHATCLDIRQSVTGILILLGYAPIIFHSKRQT